LDLPSNYKVVPKVEPKHSDGVECDESPTLLRQVIQLCLDLSGLVAGGEAQPVAGHLVFHVALLKNARCAYPSE
jgi:hypothetical protein